MTGRNKPNPKTRQTLRRLYRQYHGSEYVGLDPIAALGAFHRAQDREIAGLIAALLAYGNVKSILVGIENALQRLGPPRKSLERKSAHQLRTDFTGFRYRVTSDEQMASLLIAARKTIGRYGSLNDCFVSHLKAEDENVVPALGGFVDELEHGAGRELPHLLPHPARGSACKRLMLFLRWMVRKDCIDPGGWRGVRRDQLVIPLDTHMHSVALALGLTNRKQPNLKTAMDVTESLKLYCPDDPLKYDFALTRPGILKLTVD